MKTSKNQVLRYKKASFLNALCNAIYEKSDMQLVKIISILDGFITFSINSWVNTNRFLQVMAFIIILNPALKFFLVLDAFHTFFIDTGIDWKKALQIFVFILLLFSSTITLFKLLTRALDIAAHAQQTTSTEYKAPKEQNLKNVGK